MPAFLQQVAAHYFDRQELCFVFPNRRSLVFFRKYFAQEAAIRQRPVIAPQMCTMNDFFYKTAEFTPTDPVHQLLCLYDCYCRLNPSHESLDDFVYWGEVLLSDFNDIDKYLVDPEQLFTNISDLRAIQDNFEYLDEVQLAAIQSFISHFKTGGRYKEEFRRLWNLLLPLYHSFNEELGAQALSYEGKVYRCLAQRLKSEAVVDIVGRSFPQAKTFVFVGLNALNECERLLLRRLRDAQIAEFCWDFSSDWIRDSHNKSSFFLSANVADFPQAFKIDPEGLTMPQFNVLSVSSAVGQSKQLPTILDQIDARGIETAIVLPDETMLLPVINSIPERIRDVNVTMGYPMSGSGIWTLFSDIATLQMHLRKKGDKWYFYNKQVLSILSDSIFKIVADDADKEQASLLSKDKRYYIPVDELATTELFARIFVPVITDISSSEYSQIERLQDYFSTLILYIAERIKLSIEAGTEVDFELDFTQEYYLAINRLRSYKLPILPSTWLRFVDKLISGAAVPFRGEPLRGLQIMGPLETRSLDFDNVVILNANEGIFPRRNVSSSFIPPELRKGFALPTYEYQDAVWAYYFYRLIQRAKNVWILYDSREGGIKGGEESRYIKQLELHFGAQIHRLEAQAPIAQQKEDIITKTPEHIETLKHGNLSASSLLSYIVCPAKFYYEKVEKLSKPDEVEESLDAGAFGNAFHKVMQNLYSTPDGVVSKSMLKSLLKDNTIKQLVDQAILDELQIFELTGKNLIYEDMICKYVVKCIERDIEMLDANGKDSLNIVKWDENNYGLELTLYSKIGDFKFKGIIDRLDSIMDGELRVVDYKTGKVIDEDIYIDDGNAEAIVKKIFSPSSISDRPKVAFQLYIYNRLLSEKRPGERIVHSIYQPNKLYVDKVRRLKFCSTFMDLMDVAILRLLAEIESLDHPFNRTGKIENCKYCDFKTICGR